MSRATYSADASAASRAEPPAKHLPLMLPAVVVSHRRSTQASPSDSGELVRSTRVYVNLHALVRHSRPTPLQSYRCCCCYPVGQAPPKVPRRIELQDVCDAGASRGPGAAPRGRPGRGASADVAHAEMPRHAREAHGCPEVLVSAARPPLVPLGSTSSAAPTMIQI